MDQICGRKEKIWQNFLGMVFTMPKSKVQKNKNKKKYPLTFVKGYDNDYIDIISSMLSELISKPMWPLWVLK